MSDPIRPEFTLTDTTDTMSNRVTGITQNIAHRNGESSNVTIDNMKGEDFTTSAHMVTGSRDDSDHSLKDGRNRLSITTQVMN